MIKAWYYQNPKYLKLKKQPILYITLSIYILLKQKFPSIELNYIVDGVCVSLFRLPFHFLWLPSIFFLPFIHLKYCFFKFFRFLFRDVGLCSSLSCKYEWRGKESRKHGQNREMAQTAGFGRLNRYGGFGRLNRYGRI